MSGVQLYRQMLGVKAPWEVREVELRHDGADAPGWGGLGLPSGEVVVHVEHVGDAACPKCGAGCAKYDGLVRWWRHLDTMQYRTRVVARVPRVRCGVCGVHQLGVPWADEMSRFTALFDALAIDWLKAASVAAVARWLGLSWGRWMAYRGGRRGAV